MAEHDWCHDIPRDEAVRAAEDGRTGPLPTLEEAISRAGQFTPQEPPQEPKCTERESGLRTELVTLEVTHRFEDPIARVLLGALDSVLSGQGESVFVMDGSCEITKLTDERDAAIRERDEAIAEPFVEPAKCSPAVSETGETQSGLRTERVTLEVTHSVPVASWDWTNILETYRPGESVRVVEEVHFDDLANMSLERDAATQRAARDAVKCSALADKVIALRARVASLESQLESVACRAATAENRVADLEAAAKAAPEASEDGESNHAAPQPAKGWLTAEERRLIEGMMESASAFPPTMHWHSGLSVRDTLRVMESLLARSSPPEVVLPALHTRSEVNEANHKSPCLWLKRPDVIEALASAGVKVKEVG